jgi:Reverse transcriptase (RNA-dependent DNA polymerase)
MPPPPVIPLAQDDQAVPMNYLFRTCGVNILQTRECLVGHGYDSLIAFRHLNERSLESIAKSLNKGQFAVWPKLGDLQMRNLLALARWVQSRYLMGLDMDPFLFTPAQCLIQMEEADGEAQMQKDKKDVPAPAKFEGDKWVDWHEAIVNYFSQRLGYASVPLVYVIRRDDQPPEVTEATELSRKIYHAPLVGVNFTKDSREVAFALKAATLNTPGWQFIKDLDLTQDGRQMMNRLRQHYEGPHFRGMRIAEAEKILEKTYYENENRLTFEKFTIKLTSAYNTLRNYNAAPTAEMQVLHLCRSIRCTAPAVQTAVYLARTQPLTRNNFQEAVAAIGETIYTTFPRGTSREEIRRIGALGVPGSTRGQQHGQQGSGGRSAPGRGRFPGRGDSGRGSVPVYANPNQSNPHNLNWLGYRSEQDWREMSSDEHQAILRGRDENPRGGGRGGRGRSGGRGRGRGPGRGVASVTTQDDGSLASSLSQTPQYSNQLPPAVGLSAVTTNNPGDAFGRRTRQRTDNSPSVHFDPNLPRTNAAFNTYDRRETDECGRVVMVDVSAARATVYDPISRTEELEEFVMGRVEIDNHADTHALGANCLVIWETGRTCSVSPFSNTYTALTNVPIVSAATAYDDPKTGETIILVFNEGVWLGDRMQNTLLNPNQARITGVQICDDPFDPHRSLGIFDPVTDISVPLDMFGSFAGVETRLPSPQEVNECRKLPLSSNQQWDPQSTLLNYREACTAIVPRSVDSMVSRARHSVVTPESLASRWHITIEQAQATFKATEQASVRYAKQFLSRRYPLSAFLGGRIRITNTRFYTDTMHARTVSLQNHKFAQIFCSEDTSFVYVVSLASKADAGQALREFCNKVGIPAVLICDGASEQKGLKTLFQETAREFDIQVHLTEPHTPQQNRTENVIGILRRRWRYRVVMQRVSYRLWDYALVYESQIMTRTARSPSHRTGFEKVVGRTPDISEWLDFTFYDRVWYWYQPGDEDNPRLGRWIGVAEQVGSGMTYWILGETGTVTARSTVQHVTDHEMLSYDMRKRLEEFDAALAKAIKPGKFLDIDPLYSGTYIEDYLQENDEMEAPVVVREDYTPEAYDRFVGAELYLPNRGEMVLGRVSKRLRGEDGNPIGVRNLYPIFDTRRYQVVLSDGSVQEYSANMIAEYLAAAADRDGRQHDVFCGIVDHYQDYEGAIPWGDMNNIGNTPYYAAPLTTLGWYVCVEWADNSTSWLPLSQVKQACPVLLAQYAKANKLLDEEVFVWWAPKMLRTMDVIIGKVKTKRYWALSHKFGVRLPKTVKEAFDIDRAEGNDLWQKAIEKEMLNVRPAFSVMIGASHQDVLERRVLVGHTRIPCHMVFDVKMESLTRKARLVAGGHMTEETDAITYSSVVSRESVRIGLLLASLEDTRILAADIGNAYLNAECREQVYTIAGPEFGNDEGKVMKIVQALYGLRTSGIAWRSMFAGTMKDLGFAATQMDPDVYTHAALHSQHHTYYERILVYVDDILAISDNPEAIMVKIAEMYRLKDGSVCEPKLYLGADLAKRSLASGLECWSMSAEGYIRSTIANIERQLKSEGMGVLRAKAPNPFKTGYRPEADVTQPLPSHAIRYYQGLIGVARWCCELGRIDIAFEVSRLSSFTHSPREGHLDAMLDVFAYLKRHPKASIVFDPELPVFKEAQFIDRDWADFYPDAAELISPKDPVPLGANNLVMTCFVDADFAGDQATRRSQAGILIFLNKAPIQWFSKQQHGVESATFGAEFTSMRIAVDLIVALRQKLRSFGVAITEPTNVFCDNEAVVRNCIYPESTIKKKHNQIGYHRVREAVAAKIIRIAYVPTEHNLADGLTKSLSGPRRRSIYSRILDGLYNEGDGDEYWTPADQAHALMDW